MKKPDIIPAYFSQVDAARYLGVSVGYFAKFVDVEPIPFPASGQKPLERYARADLDGWAERNRPVKGKVAS